MRRQALPDMPRQGRDTLNLHKDADTREDWAWAAFAAIAMSTAASNAKTVRRIRLSERDFHNLIALSSARRIHLDLIADGLANERPSNRR